MIPKRLALHYGNWRFCLFIYLERLETEVTLFGKTFYQHLRITAWMFGVILCIFSFGYTTLRNHDFHIYFLQAQ